MTESKRVILGLDVGERRIGVAIGDSIGRLSSPLTTLDVDGLELVRLQRLMLENEVSDIVVGLPRNMSGEETKQTESIRQFVVRRLNGFAQPVHFQDESLTSVKAEQELASRKKPFARGDIDALAATYILDDYMEATYGH
jgi:putative Holliday junction resolvase